MRCGFGLAGYNARKDHGRSGVLNSGGFQHGDPLLETPQFRFIRAGIGVVVVGAAVVGGIGRTEDVL